MKETWLILSNTARDFSYAVEIERELAWFDIGIFDNNHNWGLTVVDPDGNITNGITKHGEEIRIKVEFADKELTISCYANKEDECYELCIIE